MRGDSGSLRDWDDAGCAPRFVAPAPVRVVVSVELLEILTAVGLVLSCLAVIWSWVR